jgi:hypothetical protein
MRVAALVALLLLPLAASAADQTTGTFAIRGQEQSLRVYGRRGGPVAVAIGASGDGGWVHLSTADMIGSVAPLPAVAFHFTKDGFVSVDNIRRMISRGLEPKKLRLVEAPTHCFSGKELDLGRKLLDGIAWIHAQRR